MISYTVSARKSVGINIIDWLKINYAYDSIDSVFGFSDFTPLYGGRPFLGAEIQDIGLSRLYDNGIGYRIPLTNHFATLEEYKSNRWFLDKHHRPGNCVICVNDELAEWILNDYPFYTVEASAIKKLDKLPKIGKALELYNTVVLPADCNDNTEMLEAIKEKSRVRLFARAGCAYTCPSRICYRSFSERMKDESVEMLCSVDLKDREHLGITEFDVKPFIDMGYTKFKSVPL